LFPLITPSPVPAASGGVGSAFPVITPSPAATSSAGTPGYGQARSGLQGRDESLALSEPLAGSRQAGLVFILLAVVGAAGWLLLARHRAGRAPLTPPRVPATSPAIGRGTPGIAPAGTYALGGLPPGAPRRGLAIGDPLAGSGQAGLVLTLLAVAGAAGWLLLGRVKKRHVA
jgi:hypothetical protein